MVAWNNRTLTRIFTLLNKRACLKTCRLLVPHILPLQLKLMIATKKRKRKLCVFRTFPPGQVNKERNRKDPAKGKEMGGSEKEETMPVLVPSSSPTKIVIRSRRILLCVATATRRTLQWGCLVWIVIRDWPPDYRFLRLRIIACQWEPRPSVDQLVERKM